MVRVPFDWSQDYKKDTYNQLVTRINKFNKVSVIGADISNTYNMYKIEMGKLDGPTIYVQASLHGNEWEGTTFSMRFMEMLRDNQIGDRQFRNHLLSRYHIVYLPMANPWGFANDNRYNEVGEDLNRDFYDFTQKESRLLRDDYQRHLPFSFLDIHLMQILYNSHELIIGSGHYEHMQITNEWSDDWEAYMGEPVRRWTPSTTPETSGLARQHVTRAVRTPYLDRGIPLSFITEITRETDTGVYFTRPQIMKAGMAQMYLFFKYSMHYFETRTQKID